jgi:GntR family transcriptional regulator
LTVAAIDGLPLYRRIETDVRDRIRTGELAPGARVETEIELMERYGVSRATVRQALGSPRSAP